MQTERVSSEPPSTQACKKGRSWRRWRVTKPQPLNLLALPEAFLVLVLSGLNNRSKQVLRHTCTQLLSLVDAHISVLHLCSWLSYDACELGQTVEETAMELKALALRMPNVKAVEARLSDCPHAFAANQAAAKHWEQLQCVRSLPMQAQLIGSLVQDCPKLRASDYAK